ncbi:ABC transporter permease [Desulfosporosinus sp.]|uniref:ABC transporter permease n=1 Tax=Desulfosporosinus sp. TaxID=157907 RepID=UPI002313BA4D|nr:ABC transporter permease [Desulfosporosinus sp.]MDA8223182.1 ABC transporter permease [Desulfitobacterium hafniense]
MNVFQIAYYTVLRNIRDWKLFLLLIGAPLLMYLIVGNVATNVDQYIRFEKVKVAYFDADGGPTAQQFNRFLQTTETLTAFDIQKADSLTEGTQMVKGGKIEALIYLKSDLSESLDQGKKTKIEIYSNRSSSASRLLVESFINTVNAASAIGKIGGDIDVTDVSGGIQQIAVSSTGKILNNADKYPFLGSLEMLSYGALLGCFSVINSIKKNTLIRFNIAPINRFAYVKGQFLGNFLTLCPSSGLFIAYTYYVWGAFMQGNILNIILAFVPFTAALTALGMIVGYLTKKIGLGVLITVCLNALLTGAAFVWALGSAQGFLKWILFLSPQYHVYLIVTDTIFDGFASRIQVSLISMAIGATVLAAVTLLWGRRKTV